MGNSIACLDGTTCGVEVCRPSDSIFASIGGETVSAALAQKMLVFAIASARSGALVSGWLEGSYKGGWTDLIARVN
jgi:hypothetical protein